MKRILSIVTAVFILSVGNATAEMGVGITGNFASVETSGSETL